MKDALSVQNCCRALLQTCTPVQSLCRMRVNLDFTSPDLASERAVLVDDRHARAGFGGPSGSCDPCRTTADDYNLAPFSRMSIHQYGRPCRVRTRSGRFANAALH